MDVFVFFAMFCFLMYIQASIFVIRRNPFAGINYLFSLMSFLFAIWYLAYIFSYMGEGARSLFPPAVVTLTGLSFVPAFYLRIGMSLLHAPRKTNHRNVVFLVFLFLGLSLMLMATSSNNMLLAFDSYVLNNPTGLLAINASLLMANIFIFSRLQFSILKPDLVSDDILEKMNGIFILCDERFIVKKINAFTANLTGVKPVDRHDKLIMGLFSDHDLVLERLHVTLEQGFSGSIDTFMTSNHGARIPVRIECHRLEDFYHDIHGIAITGEDITDEIHLLKDITHLEDKELRLKTASKQLQTEINEYSLELADINKHLYEQYSTSHQEKIKDDFEERDYLIGEIHDRVIVNMNLAVLLIHTHQKEHYPKSSSDALINLSQRVRSILLIHEFLYLSINHSEVDFKGFLLKLVNELKIQYDDLDHIRVSFNLVDRFLDIQRAVSLGLVANELITNCFMHAFKHPYDDALIQISFMEDVDSIRLIVKDNGCGIYKNFNINAYKSTGLALCEVLVKDQIDGRMDFDIASGTMVTVTFSGI